MFKARNRFGFGGLRSRSVEEALLCESSNFREDILSLKDSYKPSNGDKNFSRIFRSLIRRKKEKKQGRGLELPQGCEQKRTRHVRNEEECDTL